MRTTASVLLGLTALGLGSAACGQTDAPEPPPAVTDVFEQLLLPPNPQFVSRSGSADALQIVLRSSMSRDAVVDFYRRALTGGQWTIRSDRADQEGVHTLYAERHGRPIWIRVRAEGQASRVELAGAVVKLQPDSLAADSAAPPPDSLD